MSPGASGLLQSWQFWASLAAVSAALTSLFAKLGLQGLQPDVATFLRTVVVVLCLAVVLAASGQLHGLELGSLPRASLLALALSGLATTASWLCYFRALQLGPVARVAPIDKLSVVLVALLGVIVLGEQLSWRSWLGVALIALGGVLVALP
ncbi:EamA family transporter [Cyanobium sp. PCC 7001]|uniref:EamA family transporter n=1 Tax=Cyanobium sp. PCC 7001 TaxID=180281 RepID=UPI0002E6E1C8|nr:EamA family transporter [Cyanobium sp. PCC 7001]